CVQYRETDFNFIARLAEEEGIHYFFEHDAHETRLVFSDSRGTYTAIGEQIDLPFVEPSGLQPSCEHVYAFNMSDEVRPGAYVLRDYNFKRPELDLQCAAYAEKHRALEISDYPGEYELRGGGDHVAKIRIEEMECRRRTGHGSANSRRLAPGRYFDLNEHPQPGHDGTYLVTRVIHRGRHLGGRSNHGGGGHLSKVDARVRQVIARAAEHEDEVVRELAGVLSQVIGAGDATDGSRPRTLPRWLVHGGQIAQDAASSYSALGADPLDAASLLRVLGAAGSNGNGHAAGSANQAAYECQFECIPCDITFRPSRVTPWPVMRGCQTATVVGPKDEEIHTDEHGRVKVQFHWDREGQRNEKSSCWIRVSQPWAGVRYGGMAIPRIGQEVIVDFLEGDPDRPIITGRVYNAKTMPPQDLPKDKVRTSIRSQTHKGKGFNEITMDDTTGQEHFYMKSQYDKTEEIGHNRNTSVGLDSTEIVANNVSESVGNNMSTDVTNAYSINCDTMMINAKTSITFQCGASRIHMNQAGFISITGTVITSAATVNNSMVAPMTEVVGAIMLTQAGAVVLIEGGATHVRGEVLAALKGAEVNVVAKADNVIQGGQVKIN
ncbi:MAG TPA: type VI secretion system tip protein TssI/VgrG, partial [Phycisphaerae bacterium]|nr:type VI secretion system tip protein TssI/VgrG [Phycisphaerae bacterium]